MTDDAAAPAGRSSLARAGDRARAMDLLRDGRSVRDVADAVGASSSTISRWAAAEGVPLDRSATARATVARSALNAHRRARLVTDLLDDAEALRGRLGAGDAPRDVRDLWGAMGSAARAIADLSRESPAVFAPDVEEAASMLDRFFSALTVTVEAETPSLAGVLDHSSVTVTEPIEGTATS